MVRFRFLVREREGRSGTQINGELTASADYLSSPNSLAVPVMVENVND